MLLTIDVGNTNTVFALFDNQVLVNQWRLSTNANRTADEYGFWLSSLLKEQHASLKLTDIVLATVVPRTQFELVQCCKHYFSLNPVIVNAHMKGFPLTLDVEHPEEVGADRLVNAVEAWKRYHCALVIVDFGTATTFDVVSSAGEYVGGVIAPGINLSLEALHSAAARLPSIRIDAPSQVIGRNTVLAMQSGIYYGYAGMIDGVLTRIAEEQPGVSKVIATGGLAPLYGKVVPRIDHVITDLTIYGLATLYYQHNQ